MTTSASRVQIVLEMAISDQKKKDYTDDGAGCAPKDILVCSVACDIYIYIYIYIFLFFFLCCGAATQRGPWSPHS